MIQLLSLEILSRQRAELFLAEAARGPPRPLHRLRLTRIVLIQACCEQEKST